MKIISLGMGMQSTAMYFMSSVNILPRADFAVFADTGAENPGTLDMVDYVINWRNKNDGIPIYIVREKNIENDLLNKSPSTGQRFASVPAFSEGGGMIRRQCTAEYKISPVMQEIRKRIGLRTRQRMKPIDLWIGITTDEVTRIKPSRLYNVTNKYPLIDIRFSRGDCAQWMHDNGHPIPVKSGCYFCPFHSNKNWASMKKNQSATFEKACLIDESIRDSSKKGLKEKMYLHRSLKPLREANLNENQIDLFEAECEGICGV